MARIRTIKPEFPQSESMGRVSREARLCFILLWTIADDSGRLRASSRMLASLLYPYDDDAYPAINGWLDELEREGCIVRYSHDGTTYAQILKWLIHQKIDRPSPSRIPEYDPNSMHPREPSRAFDEPSTTDLGSRTMDHGSRKKEENARSNAPANSTACAPMPAIAAAGKPPATRGRQIPADFNFSPDLAAIADRHGLNGSGEAEFEHFKAYHQARGSIMKDWGKAWVTWCCNAKKFKGGNGPPAQAKRGKVDDILEYYAGKIK